MERRDKGKEVWEVGSKVRSRREERRGRSGEYYSIYVYTYWIVYK